MLCWSCHEVPRRSECAAALRPPGQVTSRQTFSCSTGVARRGVYIEAWCRQAQSESGKLTNRLPILSQTYMYPTLPSAAGDVSRPRLRACVSHECFTTSQAQPRHLHLWATSRRPWNNSMDMVHAPATTYPDLTTGRYLATFEHRQTHVSQ